MKRKKKSNCMNSRGSASVTNILPQDEVSFDERIPQEENRRNVFPVDKNDSFCLVISSCFFLIPGSYAFYNDLYFYGVVSFVTTIVSVNYWRDAVEGWRRSADLLMSKVSFAIYFISGCFFMRDLRLLAIGIPGCGMIILCYFFSNRYWEKDSFAWVYFHMVFHLFVSIEQLLVLYGGVQINAMKYFAI